MNDKQKSRWLKRVVLYCICFTSAAVIASFVGAFVGVDTYEVLTVTAGVFGGELMVTGAIKLFDREYGGKYGASTGKAVTSAATGRAEIPRTQAAKAAANEGEEIENG